jgi:hypothetical protein
MNKTVVAVIGILSVSSLIAFYIWSSNNRYYMMTGSQGVAYEVDRKTGESWMLLGINKVSHKGAKDSRHKEQELPCGEAIKVTGNAGHSYGYFSGKLYNGSDWIITRVIVSICAKEHDGSIRWSRDFSENLTIKPLSTESFSVALSGDEGIKDITWSIKKVFGYKE